MPCRHSGLSRPGTVSKSRAGHVRIASAFARGLLHPVPPAHRIFRVHRCHACRHHVADDHDTPGPRNSIWTRIRSAVWTALSPAGLVRTLAARGCSPRSSRRRLLACSASPTATTPTLASSRAAGRRIKPTARILDTRLRKRDSTLSCGLPLFDVGGRCASSHSRSSWAIFKDFRRSSMSCCDCARADLRLAFSRSRAGARGRRPRAPPPWPGLVWRPEPPEVERTYA